VINIGKRIRELRMQRGLSQRDVQHSTNMMAAHVSRVELGHTTPSLETVERLAALFGVPLHEMFRDGTERAKIVAFDGEDAPVMRVLARYVRQMNPADRALLLRCAIALTRESKQTE
jgi:transcriptional regulator with XRE-family HTH domain